MNPRDAALIHLLKNQAWLISEGRAHQAAASYERADDYMAQAARLNADLIEALGGKP